MIPRPRSWNAQIGPAVMSGGRAFIPSSHFAEVAANPFLAAYLG
jgi:hypothetical protein